MLHIPDIGMPPPFHLLMAFVDCPAKTVVDFLVDAVFVFIPDQVWHTV